MLQHTCIVCNADMFTFAGELLKELGNLVSLTNLDLGDNKFGGEFGLEAEKLGKFVTDIDRVSGREGQKHATIRLQNPHRRATLSWHSRTRVSQRHRTADFAPCSLYEFRSPSRTAISPASASCAFCFDCDFNCGRLCADPTAPTEFDSGASFVARVPATNPAVITAETDPINSRASGAGQLACFLSPLKGTALPRWELPTGTGMFLGVRDHSWIIVTSRLRSSSRAFTPLHPKQVHGDNVGIFSRLS